MASSITRTKPGGTTAVPRGTTAQPYIDPGLMPPTGYAPPTAQFNPQYGANFAGAQLPNIYGDLQRESSGALQRITPPQGLQGFFENQGWPGSVYNNLDQQLNQATHNEQLDQLKGMVSANQGFWPAQAGNLTHLAQQGLPGSQQLQNEQQQFAGMGGGVLGGQGGQYGVLDLVSQILGGGLPNQQGVESLFAPQSQMGQGAQNAALQQLMSLRGGAPAQNQAQGVFSGLLNGQPQAQQQAQGIFSGMAQGQPQAQNQAQQILSGMTQGQPQAQNQAQAVFTSLTGSAPPIQGTATSTLDSLIRGGGLSPDYVSAMRSLVLDPSREQLLGNINAMSGGGSLSSPAYQELLRKQESDFNNQLIRAGSENLGSYLGQGLQAGGQQYGQQLGAGQALAGLGGQQYGQQLGTSQALAGLGGQQFGQGMDVGSALAGLGGQQFGQQLGAGSALSNLGGQQFGQQFDIGQGLGQMGQQGINNALQSYGIVPQSIAPFANLGADLGTNLLNQSLQRFGTGNQLGLQNLSTIQGLSMDPMQMLQNTQFGGADRQNQLLSQLLNSGLQYQGQQQQQALQQQGMQTDLLSRILAGEYGNEQSRAMQSQANKGMWGNIIGAGLGAVPGIGGLLAGLFR